MNSNRIIALFLLPSILILATFKNFSFAEEQIDLTEKTEVQAAEPDTASEEAPESPWSLDKSIAFYTDYVFRGNNLYNGNSIQPSIGLNYDFGDYGILTGSFWSHFSAESSNQDEKFTETDFTIKYDFTVDDVSFSLGNSWYRFPHNNTTSGLVTNSQEYYISAAYDSYLTPTLSFFHDYDVYDTRYFELSISHSFALGESEEDQLITPFYAIGYVTNGLKYYSKDAGVTHMAFGINGSFLVGDAEIVPTISFSKKMDEFTQNVFWSGFAVNF